MNRRNVITASFGAMFGSSAWLQASEYLYPNLLDIVGAPIPKKVKLDNNYQLRGKPIFVEYFYDKNESIPALSLRLTKGVKRSFPSRNDANRHILQEINDLLTHEDSIIPYGPEALIVRSCNKIAIETRRGPASHMIITKNTGDELKLAATRLRNNNFKDIHINDINETTLFYKGSMHFDMPLSYLEYPDGHLDLYMAPQWKRNFRKIKAI